MPDLDDGDLLPHGVHAVAECPPLALIRAWKEDALPEELVHDVAAHVSECGICRTLLLDLERMLQPGITATERDRIRHKLPLVSASTPWRPGWQWYAIASAVAALVVGGLFLTVHQVEHPREALNVIQTVPSVGHALAPPAAFTPVTTGGPATVEVQVAKLAPPVDLSPGLAARGAPPFDEPDTQQLTPAFAAYDSGDYALATQLFSQLAKQFPRSGRPFLYLGVAQLLTDDNADALFNLTRAEQFVAPADKDAASWYRLAASARAHASDTEQLARALCNRNRSNYAQMACQIEKSLASKPD